MPGAPPRRGLADYDARRDFSRTPEPAPAAPGAPAPGSAGRRFVVQRHRARRLHYDLRLEVDGVLASWAVPRGPTLDPDRRTLAVQVEDHPMEYAGFEGVIPAGEYGGGDVVVWDRGTWRPAGTDDPAAAIAAGELHFDLDGDKLAGRFALVRTRRGRGRDQWLLLHKHDEVAQPGWDPEDHPASVLSGRTNDEVAADPGARWHGDRAPSVAEERLERRGGPAAAGAPVTARRAATPAELARLEALGDGGRWQVGGHRLALSGLDDPVLAGRGREPPVTRRDLLRYHSEVAPVLLPWLAGRPVEVAGPRGRGGDPEGDLVAVAPRWVRRWTDPATGRRRLVVDDLATLAWAVGHGAVELRPWATTTVAPHQPTWVVIGVRPGRDTSPEELALLGGLHRRALEYLGVVGGAAADGRGGLTVWIPVRPGPTGAELTAWAGELVRSIAASVPDLVRGPSPDGGRDRRARLVHRQSPTRPGPVAPYGVVGRRGAPVAVPLAWPELDDAAALAPLTVGDVPARLARVGDPFAGLAERAQDLPTLRSTPGGGGLPATPGGSRAASMSIEEGP